MPGAIGYIVDVCGGPGCNPGVWYNAEATRAYTLTWPAWGIHGVSISAVDYYRKGTPAYFYVGLAP